MSWVTTVVVASPRLSTEDKAFIQGAVADLNRGGGTFAEPDHCDGAVFGGTKCAESDVLLGAFNYLQVEEFVEKLRTRAYHAGVYVLAFSNGEFVTTYMQDAKRSSYDVGGDIHHFGLVNVPQGATP